MESYLDILLYIAYWRTYQSAINDRNWRHSSLYITDYLYVFFFLKPRPWVWIAVGGANIQIVHYFDHGYLEEEKSMIHSFTVTFGAKYLTGMVTSVPPYETFSLIKNNILHQFKTYKYHFKFLRYVTLVTLVMWHTVS